MGRAVSSSSILLPAASIDVARGLRSTHKSLPSYLFYDAIGSALYEKITELPEYYPTRTEGAIFAQHADEIADLLGSCTVIELGAGTATKTEILLAASVARGFDVSFMPIDVSRAPLLMAEERLAAALPGLPVSPIVGTHQEAFGRIASLPGPKAVLFIGSSIGNYEGPAAVGLLAGVRRSVGAEGVLVLGTDRVKSLDVLLPAYDDSAGVTAEFNKNVLARINRELGGHFDVSKFAHVALWNAEASQIEMHLESLADQEVRIDALKLTVPFVRGERIHTESSVKYDDARVDALLGASGFVRHETFKDPRGWFAVNVCRAS